MDAQPERYDKAEIFICDCSDIGHHIIWQLWDFGKDGELYRPASCNCELSLAVDLNYNHTFFKRVWMAIKYIFGYRSKYGHYDTMNVRYEDVPRMIALLEEFRGKVEEYKKKLEDNSDDDN